MRATGLLFELLLYELSCKFPQQINCRFGKPALGESEILQQKCGINKHADQVPKKGGSNPNIGLLKMKLLQIDFHSVPLRQTTF